MKRTIHLCFTLCLILLLSGCGSGSKAGSAPIPEMQAGIPNTPASAGTPIPLPLKSIGTSVHPRSAGYPQMNSTRTGDERAWRYLIYLPIKTTSETTIQQGDADARCKTTYNSLDVWYPISDAGLKKWLKREVKSFVDGIVKDESIIQKTRKMFLEKGLDKRYPGATFIRKVKIKASSTGGVLSLTATDYCVYRPTDADMLRDKLGWDAGDGLQYTYDINDFHAPDNSSDGVMYPEAYTYTIKTKCLDVIKRKPMKLIDLLQGEKGLQKLNLCISKQIASMEMEDNDMLKRPFTGLGADYDCFWIENLGGEIKLTTGFNEGNPWFNLETQNRWSNSRLMEIGLSGQGAMLNPILFDDRLMWAINRGENKGIYWIKYMPDPGLAEFTTSNGNKKVRITYLANGTAMERINQGIEDFESKYLNDEYIMKNLFIPEAQTSPATAPDNTGGANKTTYSASAMFMGDILKITYQVTSNRRTTEIAILFDLNTGKKLAASDILTKDYLTSEPYLKIKGKINENFVNLLRQGAVYLFFEQDAGQEEQGGKPRYGQQLFAEKYFDWEKWGNLK